MLEISMNPLTHSVPLILEYYGHFIALLHSTNVVGNSFAFSALSKYLFVMRWTCVVNRVNSLLPSSICHWG